MASPALDLDESNPAHKSPPEVACREAACREAQKWIEELVCHWLTRTVLERQQLG